MTALSDVSRRMRDGLRGARGALARDEQPRAFVRAWGELSAADKATVCREVPGFAAGFVAVCGGVAELSARRACNREVRGTR